MSNLAPVRNCPKGERKARLDNIISLGHILTNFRKISLFSVASIWTQNCHKLKNENIAPA